MRSSRSSIWAQFGKLPRVQKRLELDLLITKILVSLYVEVFGKWGVICEAIEKGVLL